MWTGNYNVEDPATFTGDTLAGSMWTGNYNYGEWYGSARALVLPKGVSQEIVDFYVNAFRKTMQDPACIEAHAKAGMSLDFKDNKQLAELIAAQEKFCRDTVAKLYKK